MIFFVETNIQIMPGTRELRVEDVTHIIIPGGGRDKGGDGLSAASHDRVTYAGALYRQLNLGEQCGRIVCSGYKSPADRRGAPWSPEDVPTETFAGIPEADSMRQVLRSLGISDAVIRVERYSIDTVTNFVRAEAEGSFGDDRPVAIVSHRSHLERILQIVAPRTLKRRFLGVAVPEGDHPLIEGRLPRLASRAILLGVTPYTPGIVEIADRRAARIWR